MKKNKSSITDTYNKPSLLWPAENEIVQHSYGERHHLLHVGFVWLYIVVGCCAGCRIYFAREDQQGVVYLKTR